MEDENSRDYRLGHQLKVISWAGIPISDWISPKGGLQYAWNEELQGDQKDINQGPMMGRNTVTTAYDENYGGETIEAPGVNLLPPGGQWRGHRLAADLSFASLSEPKWLPIRNDYVFTPGWQKS